MMQSELPVLFRVRVTTKPNEIVCVIGDCEELGNWQPSGALELSRDFRTRDEVWSKEIRLKTQEVKYRYFTCYINRSDNEEESVDVMVTRWETNIRPRRFSPFCTVNNSSDYEFETGAAVFGRYDGRESIGKGWLTNQTEVQLRIYGNPIQMWKQSQQNQRYRIACKTMDLRQRDLSVDEEDSHDQILTPRFDQQVQVSVINETDMSLESISLHDQPQFGVEYGEKDYIIFSAQCFEPEYMGFVFNFYEDYSNGSNDPPKHIGHAYILPVNMRDTQNKRTVPIHSIKRPKPIGQLTVDYLKVKPLMVDAKINSNSMEVSYAKHWKHRRPLEVGHRGFGSSHSKECAVVTENTIASLNAAGSHGADYVEFDVQLSADMHPVIYHDFEVCLTLRGKKAKDELQLFKIPVKQLTLEQLQQLQLDHVNEMQKSNKDLHRENQDPEDLQTFPLLQTCLEHVDDHIGFNIEIKYPQPFVDGTHEQTYFFEQNEYVDIILRTVLTYAGDRRIVFSCFDPDICAMVRLKQNKYPVNYLTGGRTAKWTPYESLLTRTTKHAALYSIAQDFLGVNVNAEVLLNQLDLIQFIKGLGLVLFVWGDELNDPVTKKLFLDEGVNGVIYDTINEKQTENIFKLEKEAKLRLLTSVGVLPEETNGNGTTSHEHPPLTHSQSVNF